jgi:peroxiredoxin
MHRAAALLLTCLAMPALGAPLEIGSPAPEFMRQAFDGKPVTLGMYRGKVILLDFWASWCAPCLEEMPDLINLQKRDGAKLQVIGISMDDRMEAVKSITRQFHFNYPLLLGDAKLGMMYGGILGLPVVVLVSRSGKVLKVWRGGIKPGELEKAVIKAIG